MNVKLTISEDLYQFFHNGLIDVVNSPKSQRLSPKCPDLQIPNYAHLLRLPKASPAPKAYFEKV